MAEIHEGGCLCGAIRYRTIGEPKRVGVCHCTLCKRRTGSAFGVGAYFDEVSFQVTTGALKTYEYRSDESNRWIKMEFCPQCGTSVTWTGEVVPGIRGIAVGTFDDPNWVKPQSHGFTRSALHWVVLPSDVEVYKTTPSAEELASIFRG